MASKSAVPSHLKAENGSDRHHGKTQSHVAFENTSTSVAASQMRNALNVLADSVTDEKEKARFETEMDNFFALFRRYLNDKAKGNEIDWEKISPPKPEQVVDYNSLGNSESVEFLNKLAVLKLNGGLGTSMGCVGPKSIMLVKSDLYTLRHGQLVMDPNRFGPAPLIKLGNDFKKVSAFQSRIPSIPKILELDHLTITGAVNLGRGVVCKGTVIIVATEGQTIDVPPGSILENVVVQGSLRLLEH